MPPAGLLRASYPALSLRAVSGDAEASGGMPTLVGHFARFGEWARIDSVLEGLFLERIAPGAFRDTFATNRARIRVLFQHGRDPNIGDKPLGPIAELREDPEGAYYEVPLLDTAYNRELIPGLRAGLYGASFRFTVTREDFATRPQRSAYNPDAIPERTILAANVFEFGPVVFPAYSGATAGIRSLWVPIVNGA
jgi:HK97 family phage prohead protease